MLSMEKTVQCCPPSLGQSGRGNQQALCVLCMASGQLTTLVCEQKDCWRLPDLGAVTRRNKAGTSSGLSGEKRGPEPPLSPVIIFLSRSQRRLSIEPVLATPGNWAEVVHEDPLWRPCSGTVQGCCADSVMVCVGIVCACATRRAGSVSGAPVFSRW